MSITKTKGQIIRENVFTLFNLLSFLIAAALFAVGSYSDMLFMVIIVLNTAIGTAQELKAKKMVEELSLLNQSKVNILRNDAEVLVKPEELNQGDICVYRSGDQICSDAEVIDGNLGVNESLLTGESDVIMKRRGDRLLSGSFVVCGDCKAKVLASVEASYAGRLADEVRQQKELNSELLCSMRRVTGFTSVLIIPLGVLLFLEAFFLRGAAVGSSVTASCAALLGMLPKGLVLLISVSLFAGVIRLAKKEILVQNIYALETLAHTDVICLDKTGTITTGEMSVKEIIYGSGTEKGEVEKILRAYLTADQEQNAAAKALRQRFLRGEKEEEKKVYEPVFRIPFSSDRKWGAIAFRELGTVFLGAPERIAGIVGEEAEKKMEEGCRIIAAGCSEEIWNGEGPFPEKVRPLCLIVLEDRMRKNAKETLRYFRDEGVSVKIISGDHPQTVALAAKSAGLDQWQSVIDMSGLGDNADYGKLAENYAVFARTTPEQKKRLVMALKEHGHKVAMTGDSVNDLLALREADCSIAVSEGSDASRQIAQIVLLHSDFTYLPKVVMEGRRVVNNVTRTAGVFFIKIIYSVLTVIFCLRTNLLFPFVPLQITLIDGFMEAWPSFLTIFEADTRRLKHPFLQTAVKNAFPFALSITLMIASVSMTAPFSVGENQTIMYFLLILISMLAVIKSCRPFTALRMNLCAIMAVGVSLSLILFPSLLHVHAVTIDMAMYMGAVFVGLIIFTEAMIRLIEKGDRCRKCLGQEIVKF